MVGYIKLMQVSFTRSTMMVVELLPSMVRRQECTTIVLLELAAVVAEGFSILMVAVSIPGSL